MVSRTKKTWISSLLGAVLPWRRSTEFFVEEAGREDLVAVAEIHREGFVKGWSDGEFEKMYDNDSYFLLVARRRNRGHIPPAGFVLARTMGRDAEVITIAAGRKVRRCGVGMSLMSALIRQLTADGVINLFLEVDEDNTAAIALYKRLGFSKVGERKGYYSATSGSKNPSGTALVMRLELL